MNGPSASPPLIFISHVEGDHDLAVEIARGLEKAGYHVWYYERDSKPGTQYLIEVGNAIERSAAVILLVSPSSLASRQVTNEVVRAYECGKSFVPVLRELTHSDLQARQPLWRQALGATTSLAYSSEGIGDIVHQIIAGLEALGIVTSGEVNQSPVSFTELRPSSADLPIENSRSGTANSIGTRIIVLVFENLADPRDTAGIGLIVSSLLSSGLAANKLLQVVSRQRQLDVLRQLGVQKNESLDSETASQIARYVRAKWMITGGILRTNPSLVISADIVDVPTGNLLESTRVAGGENEDVFSTVDRLLNSLRTDGVLKQIENAESAVRIQDVTTQSLEAYSHYLKGLEYYYQMYLKDAAQSFNLAVKEDPTFAMAYYYLAWCHGEPGSPKRRELSALARKYSDKLSPREKLYIAGQASWIENDLDGYARALHGITTAYPEEEYAWYWLGMHYGRNVRNADISVKCLEKALEANPHFALAYEELMFEYYDLGAFTLSEESMRKYLALAPDRPATHLVKAGLLAHKGEIANAISALETSLKQDPKYWHSQYWLGHISLICGDLERAKKCFTALCSGNTSQIRSSGRTYLALIPIYRGHFGVALEALREAIAADKMEGYEGVHSRIKVVHKAFVLSELGRHLDSLDEIRNLKDECINSVRDDILCYRQYYVELLSKVGDLSKAHQVCDELLHDIETKDRYSIVWYWYAAGCTAFARMQFQESYDYFARAIREGRDEFRGYHFSIRLMAGRSLMMLGRSEEAVSNLEWLHQTWCSSQAGWPMHSVKLHYFLALAYEQAGLNEEARREFECFLSLWGGADSTIEAVEDAKSRLKLLST